MDGVHQGSDIGPLLLLSYIGGLPERSQRSVSSSDDLNSCRKCDFL